MRARFNAVHFFSLILSGAIDLNELSTHEIRSEGGTVDWRSLRDALHDSHERANTEAGRVAALEAFKELMDTMEAQLVELRSDDLEAFRKARLQDYHLFIVRECIIGQSASVELMHATTAREIAAGRMAEDDELRAAAVAAFAEPYLTVQELLAEEVARLKG